MTIKEDLSDLPSTCDGMSTYLKSGDKLFLLFATREYFADVTNTVIVQMAFSDLRQHKVASFICVGTEDEWKDPGNSFRRDWQIRDVPTLVKYTKGPLPDKAVMKVEQISGGTLQDVGKVKHFRDAESAWGH